MKIKHYFLFIALLILISLFNTFYILDQRKSAITIQLGKVIKQDVNPGLKFKIPFLQNIKIFDKRVQNMIFNMSDHSEVVAFDQKTMKLDAYAKYKIINPKKFYETAQNDKTFRLYMNSITESSIREVIGRTIFKNILTIKRHEIRNEIIQLVNKDSNKFGVQVIDVRIIRVNLPDKARDAVYARMRTEREKEAKEIRAAGMQESDIIRATADKENNIILAEAKREAETIKGVGDAKSINIYAHSYGKDYNFYDYYKSLEIYKNSLGKKYTFLILLTSNKLLKYLN